MNNAKRVTVWEPIDIQAMCEEESEIPKLKVAAYARVSTEQDEQQSSYEAQVDYYGKYIRSNPAWEFVGIYADDTAIMGLNQNPVQTGVDLVPFFFLSALFLQMRVYLLNDRTAVSGQHPHAGRRFCIWRYIRWQRQRQELPPKKLSAFHLTSFIRWPATLSNSARMPASRRL